MTAAWWDGICAREADEATDPERPPYVRGWDAKAYYDDRPTRAEIESEER